MKTLHLAIIAGACVAVTVALFLYASFTTNPSNVHHSAPAGQEVVSSSFPSETTQVKLDCSKPIGAQMSQIDKSVDVQKAISLAYSSPDFVAKANQYGNVTYNSFFNDWVTGDPCNTIWKSIEVVFSTTDKNGIARNIQVTEDVNMTHVLNVTEYQSGFSK